MIRNQIWDIIGGRGRGESLEKEVRERTERDIGGIKRKEHKLEKPWDCRLTAPNPETK